MMIMIIIIIIIMTTMTMTILFQVNRPSSREKKENVNKSLRPSGAANAVVIVGALRSIYCVIVFPTDSQHDQPTARS